MTCFKDIITGIPWGIFLSFMIGPVFFILLETSIIKGFKSAIFFDFGVVFGDIVFIIIAYFGSYKLITTLNNSSSLFIFGGLIMLVYGFISLITVKKERKISIRQIDKDIIKKNYLGLFAKGFFLNIINIGVLGFWLAVIVSVGPSLNMEPTRIITFFCSVIITYLSIDTIKIILAKKLKNQMTPTNIYKIKKTIAAILMFFGFVLILQGYFPKEKEMIKNALEKRKTS